MLNENTKRKEEICEKPQVTVPEKRLTTISEGYSKPKPKPKKKPTPKPMERDPMCSKCGQTMMWCECPVTV